MPSAEVETIETPAPKRAPKKPQDHKPKAEKPEVEKIDGGHRVTYMGATVTIEDDALDDFELLDDIGALQQGDPARLPSVLRRLVGDQWREVMVALRGENGRVSIESGGQFVSEVLGAIAPSS